MGKKCNKKGVLGVLKRFWNFVWNDNSVWSWIVNIILAFIIIKFLIYPGLGFAFGSEKPVVAVVSESMEHGGNFDSWWSSGAYCKDVLCTQGQFYGLMNITGEDFRNFPFKNGFNKGDIMFISRLRPEEAKIGDIIVFEQKSRDPIIHRIVKIEIDGETYYFTTKGDKNIGFLETELINETRINQDLVVGKAFLRIPLLGWVKIGFVEMITVFRR